MQQITLYRAGDPPTRVMEIVSGHLNYLADVEGQLGSCLVIFDGEGFQKDLVGKGPEAAVVLGFEPGRTPSPEGFDQKAVLRLGEGQGMTLNGNNYLVRYEKLTG